MDFLEELFNFFEHLQWRCALRVTSNRFAILVNDELSEIPLDGIDQCATLLLLQKLVQWMRSLAVHVDLLEQVKFDFAILQEALNLLGIARLLIIKLITWECEDT